MRNILPILLACIVLMVACTTNKDKELFKSADEKAKAKNYSEAIKDYQKIIEDYPSSEKTSESIFAVAAMYHMNQIPNISKDESLKKAVEYYKKLYTLFPNDEKAPKSLFMSGFINANELKNIDEAKKAYQLFLNKYPNNELSQAAKSELDNLGKSPEEILKEKTAKK